MSRLNYVYCLFLNYFVLTITKVETAPIQNHFEYEKPLTKADFDAAKAEKISEDDKYYDKNAMEKGGFFQGDITGFNPSSQIVFKNAEIDSQWPKYHWDHNMVPVTISRQFSEEQRNLIVKAMREFHAKTCVRFIKRRQIKSPLHDSYVFIRPNVTEDEGCSSYVGKKDIGGLQNISLADNCFDIGIIIHELMHTLGFYHEQTRQDRDDYVQVIFDHVEPNMTYNFQKMPYTTDLNEPYDYGSIMHYSEYAFSIKDKILKTIVPLQPGVQIGQREGLSKLDVIKLNKFYECKDYLPQKNNPGKKI